ncbi:aminotransferase class IV [Psychrobacter sanguinis]|uniref:aminotransferase class IV n=1 Tax=Psychrobacter sanguinis TaxID=861445 RepID=UPI0028A1DADA|nr:aminotransferase class IV [Psychrobacter sanguinis]
MSHAMTWYQLSDTGMMALPASENAPSSTPVSDYVVTAPQQIAPSIRALAYGDGFFTTMGVHNAHLLWPSYHQARLHSHCQALQLTINPEVGQRLWQQLQQFATTIDHGMIKLIISRPAQNLRGYAYSTLASDNEALIWIGVMKTAPLAQQTAQFLPINQGSDSQCSEQIVLQQSPIIAKCLQSQLASLPQPLAGLKSLNRLDGVMIAGELQRHKQQNPELVEGLVADMGGNWVEGVMSNIFYQLKPKPDATNSQQTSLNWYTPPIIHSGVRGIMRQVIMDRLASQGVSVQERLLRDADLSQIESMFFCNAVRGVIPVQQLWFQDERFQLSLVPIK